MRLLFGDLCCFSLVREGLKLNRAVELIIIQVILKDLSTSHRLPNYDLVARVHFCHNIYYSSRS